MSDSQTTVAQLRQIVERFVDQRDWAVFHNPKNLAMSISIEAAELMEHFQWLSAEQAYEAAEIQEKREEIADEMSDILAYLLAMANRLDMDLSTALENKMVKNRQKYPSEEYRGRFGPDDPRGADAPE